MAMPTAEWVEAIGRAEEKYGAAASLANIQEELNKVLEGDSICAAVVNVEAKHLLVAARYPNLYVGKHGVS
jgi:hypothetical protein